MTILIIDDHPMLAAGLTSTLQQEAARKLGFSSKRTMTVAQQLYEGVDLGSDGGAPCSR